MGSDALAEALRVWLPTYGPWLLFALAALETSFVTGLVVPSGVATSIGTALALEGEMTLAPLLLAALAGGWVGDSAGFWIGDRVGHRFLEGNGKMAEMMRERRTTLDRFFGRHPVYSVSLARLVSFVRTLMPMAAGMSDLPYRRFLPYEAMGLVGWLALYVALGVAAGESWQWATQAVGVGGALALSAGLVLLVVMARRRRRPPAEAPARRAATPAEATADGAGDPAAAGPDSDPRREE